MDNDSQKISDNDRIKAMINDDQKIRLILSSSAQMTIAEDMDIFGVDKRNQFINTVLNNYFKYAKTSLLMYRTNRISNLCAPSKDEHMSTEQLENKEAVVTDIVDAEIREYAEDIKKSLRVKGDRRFCYINNYNMRFLASDGYKEYSGKDMLEYSPYKRPSQYLRAVIEEYCSLPFIRREEIFKKEAYDIIKQAKKDNYVLHIPNAKNPDQIFVVYPHEIVPNKSHTQSYLLCYSKIKGIKDSKMKIVSFSMARLNISEANVTSQNFKLTKEQEKNIVNILEHQEVEYLLNEPESIEIRLTETGKKIYNSRIYMRPKRTEIKDNNIWVFNCTQLQAYNFFFSFGENAEVINPPELRNRFIQSVNKMSEIYSHKTTDN